MVALQYKASQETVEFLVAKGANDTAKDKVPEYYSDFAS
jgi:flagellar biosynthesis protein FlhB